uniref:Uncharacterized protein n=1 Tax=Brassica oleracea TaxID=3712 RepID=A0A3P6ER02_BRAOL|nr:unnamed protein product [Brassica oleracea]
MIMIGFKNVPVERARVKPCRNQLETLESWVNDQEASSSTSPLGPTVFRVGSYSGNLSTESRVDGKKSRRRPQKWKRLRNPEKVCTSGPRP